MYIHLPNDSTTKNISPQVFCFQNMEDKFEAGVTSLWRVLAIITFLWGKKGTGNQIWHDGV
jgi:hypothetical protein